MRVRLVVILGLVTVFLAAGAGVFGLGDGAGPTVDVSHAQAPDEKVHREVLEALETQPWADVIVALREPPAARRVPLDLPALQQQVAAEQGKVLSGLSGADFEVLRRYDSIPAVFGRVSVAGLEKLLAHPEVISVHLNLGLHATLSESVLMINADDVHTMGYTGGGVTVAVLDTGIDTNHPDLQDDLMAEHCYLSAHGGTCPCGGATAHGPGCAEDGDGHGSHVSGIITSGGLVASGGVAPDTDIIAFKVLDDTGSGHLGDTLDALNYITGHPGDGVDAINMSLGSGPWTTPCDAAWPEMTTAFNTLRSAGVTTFVASGNDADKSQLGFPSCISSAVSVGDVYDANVGGIIWGDPEVCRDTSTWADLVVCHSNSHSTLDLLAPGALITSSVNGGGTANYGGTSMAAPHAAGVAALMLNANPLASPGEIESCMENTGIPITDPANGVTAPRVDALGAVQCILPGGTPTPTPTDTPTPTATATPTPVCIDRLGDTSCDDPVNDPDDDGCTTDQEAALGSVFDPNAWYDVYDVPVPARPDADGANGTRDKVVDIRDVLAVLLYVFADDNGPENANGVDYDTVKGVDVDGDTDDDAAYSHGIEEGLKYDRSPGLGADPVTGIDPVGPPNSVIDMGDVLATLAQAFVVDCSGAP